MDSPQSNRQIKVYGIFIRGERNPHRIWLMPLDRSPLSDTVGSTPLTQLVGALLAALPLRKWDQHDVRKCIDSLGELGEARAKHETDRRLHRVFRRADSSCRHSASPSEHLRIVRERRLPELVTELSNEFGLNRNGRTPRRLQPRDLQLLGMKMPD